MPHVLDELSSQELGHEQGHKLMTKHPHVSGSLIGQPNTAKHLLSGRIGPGVPTWALLLRAIPITISLVLFVLVASADVAKWGTTNIRSMLIVATLFGVVGIFLFIPGRDMPIR
jgi:hypothetical protein